MRWSLFDSKNTSTLDDVRQKLGVSSERLKELQFALDVAKAKVHLARPSSKNVGRRVLREEAVTNNLVQNYVTQLDRGHLSLTAEVLDFFQAHPKKKILGILNAEGVRRPLQERIRAEDVVLVTELGVRGGVKKAFKLNVDNGGRINMLRVTAGNPKVKDKGLYKAKTVSKATQCSRANQKKGRSSTHETDHRAQKTVFIILESA